MSGPPIIAMFESSTYNAAIFDLVSGSRVVVILLCAILQFDFVCRLDLAVMTVFILRSNPPSWPVSQVH